MLFQKIQSQHPHPSSHNPNTPIPGKYDSLFWLPATLKVTFTDLRVSYKQKQGGFFPNVLSLISLGVDLINISKISYTEEHTGTPLEAKTDEIIQLLMSYVSQL